MSKTIDVSECKCWEVPFEPPEGCFDYCAGKILRMAKPNDLELYLNIKQPLADKIFELTSNEELNNLSDFQPFLTDKEYDEVDFQLRNISQEGQKWINITFKMTFKVEENIAMPA